MLVWLPAGFVSQLLSSREKVPPSPVALSVVSLEDGRTHQGKWQVLSRNFTHLHPLTPKQYRKEILELTISDAEGIVQSSETIVIPTSNTRKESDHDITDSSTWASPLLEKCKNMFLGKKSEVKVSKLKKDVITVCFHPNTPRNGNSIDIVTNREKY